MLNWITTPFAQKLFEWNGRSINLDVPMPPSWEWAFAIYYDAVIEKNWSCNSEPDGGFERLFRRAAVAGVLSFYGFNPEAERKERINDISEGLDAIVGTLRDHPTIADYVWRYAMSELPDPVRFEESVENFKRDYDPGNEPEGTGVPELYASVMWARDHHPNHTDDTPLPWKVFAEWCSARLQQHKKFSIRTEFIPVMPKSILAYDEVDADAVEEARRLKAKGERETKHQERKRRAKPYVKLLADLEENPDLYLAIRPCLETGEWYPASQAFPTADDFQAYYENGNGRGALFVESVKKGVNSLRADAQLKQFRSWQHVNDVLAQRLNEKAQR